ncbi:MAG TPA: PadR family transcriptional regulator [Mycobacterium sp.]|nr:PadR family transcriptional regulator [Mycobacterium sp.]
MSLRIAALGLLAQRPGSGYDLLRRFEKSMANVWPATQSQLYSELNKLADGGLIEVSAVGARGRKEYRITEAGHGELQRWVTNPQDDPPFRNAALLRVFLLNLIPAGQARVHLETMAKQSDAEVARLSKLGGPHDRDDAGGIPDHDFFALAALDYGLRLNTMRADWARDVIAKLDARPTDVASR